MRLQNQLHQGNSGWLHLYNPTLLQYIQQNRFYTLNLGQTQRK